MPRSQGLPKAARWETSIEGERNFAAAGLLVAAVVAAYANSFLGPFVFDDVNSIVENPSIRHLRSWRVLAAPSDAITAVGRPVLNVSLAINYAIGGLNVWDYHAANLAIHVLGALALFGVVRRTLLLPALAERLGRASRALALVVALLWALHPLQTESVTYIVQRAEAIVSLFYLLTLYCVLRGVTSSRGRAWYAAATAACGLGMASKEIMVSAPLIVLLYDRTFVCGSFREALRRRKGLYLGLSATWALLALLVYLSHGRGESAGFNMGMTVWEYARTQFGCIVHYLRLAFWPAPLILDYGTDVADTAAQIVPCAVAVGLLLTATATALIRWPRWGFLGAWFFAILAPTSTVVPIVSQVEAEHRMYLPLAAVVTLGVLGAYAGLRLGCRRFARAGASAPQTPSPWRRRAAGAIVLAAAAALGCATWQRNQDYRSAMAILKDTLDKCPSNFRVRAAYAAELANTDPDAALRQADLAVAQEPSFATSYFLRAGIYQAKGLPDAAIRDLGKAVELRPRYAAAYGKRAAAYSSMEQYDAALKDCDRAIELKPDSAEAYNNRAVVRYRMKAYEQAWADVRTCRGLGGAPESEFVEALKKASGASE
jgi:Tfp pilus assembly protein PilF